ncbi:MAG: hypothetical protein ILM98_12770 [Kiritimatiellae bacterium]|nr:hypothetical protein [Kiritimatiellia bacterium]
METWGRGIQKIVDSCAANGNPPPTFEYDGSMLSIVFKAEQGSQRPSRGQERAKCLEKPNSPNGMAPMSG